MTPAIPAARRSLGLTYARSALRGLALSVPVALVMTAAAALVVEVVAIPLAWLATRDVYVALLAPSFGLYAAGLVLLWVVAATLIWSLLHPAFVGQTPARILLGAGVTSGLAALIGWLLLMFWAPDTTTLFRWHYGPLPRATLTNSALIALSGVLAGLVSAWRSRVRAKRDCASTGAWRQALRDGAWFAFVLALSLECWVALVAAFGAA